MKLVIPLINLHLFLYLVSITQINCSRFPHPMHNYYCDENPEKCEYMKENGYYNSYTRTRSLNSVYTGNDNYDDSSKYDDNSSSGHHPNGKKYDIGSNKTTDATPENASKTAISIMFIVLFNLGFCCCCWCCCKLLNNIQTQNINNISPLPATYLFTEANAYYDNNTNNRSNSEGDLMMHPINKKLENVVILNPGGNINMGVREIDNEEDVHEKKPSAPPLPL